MSVSNSTVKYKKIPEFPGYKIGDDGTVWSKWRTSPKGRFKKTYRELKQSFSKKKNRKKYHYLNLTNKDGKTSTYRVHRLVLLAFCGPCPQGKESRHLDGNPHNNKLENLQWGTPEENREDIRKHGTYKKGKEHHYTKLTEQQVKEIRKLYLEEGMLMKHISAKYNISIPNVSAIVNYRSWKHLK